MAWSPSVSETVGDRIRLARQEMGWPVAYLAGLVGVSADAEYKWERGLHRPRPAHLAALAYQLVVPAEWLWSGGPRTWSRQEVA
jgi:transcriptional regulator with XRE-family HTH domain